MGYRGINMSNIKEKISRIEGLTMELKKATERSKELRKQIAKERAARKV